MKPVYLTITGTMGSGKTTVGKLLAERLSNVYLLVEHFEDNPFLELFYAQPQRWAFHSQTFFLLEKIKQLHQVHDLQKNYQVVIQDTPIQQDVFSYAQGQYLSGNMTDAEFGLYTKIYSGFMQQVPEPDLIIWLDADIPTMQKRIQNRDRSFEKSISSEYLALLDKLNRKWLGKIASEKKLIINSNQYNFVANTVDQEWLVALVKKRLTRLSPRHSSKS